LLLARFYSGCTKRPFEGFKKRLKRRGHMGRSPMASQCKCGRRGAPLRCRPAAEAIRALGGRRTVCVETAKHLLVESKMPIAEVAVTAGFADQSHFTKHFGYLVGTTPWRFRSQA
jgi:AraC-like DNA-binding protein